MLLHPGDRVVDDRPLPHEAGGGGADCTSPLFPGGEEVLAETLEVPVVALQIGVGDPAPPNE